MDRFRSRFRSRSRSRYLYISISISLSLSLYTYMYIYIYIYTQMCNGTSPLMGWFHPHFCRVNQVRFTFLFSEVSPLNTRTRLPWAILILWACPRRRLRGACRVKVANELGGCLISGVLGLLGDASCYLTTLRLKRLMHVICFTICCR